MVSSDNDIATALVIALVVLAIAVCVWPGFARVRARDLAGYWQSTAETATLYEIRPDGARTFVVTGIRPETPGFASSKAVAIAPVAGAASFVRHVSIPAFGKKGSLELGGRRLEWADGSSWVRQGV